MLWEKELESVPLRASLLESELVLSDKFFYYWQGFKSQKNKCSTITCFPLFKSQVVHCRVHSKMWLFSAWCCWLEGFDAPNWNEYPWFPLKGGGSCVTSWRFVSVFVGGNFIMGVEMSDSHIKCSKFLLPRREFWILPSVLMVFKIINLSTVHALHSLPESVAFVGWGRQ